MSTNVTNIEESFNVAKFIPQYASEARHPFFNAYREEVEQFSRVSLKNLPHPQSMFSVIS